MPEFAQIPVEAPTHAASPTLALLASVHLAEYNCLRGEILALINIEHACIGLGLGVITAVLSLKNDLAKGYGWAIVLTLSCLGIIYCDLDSRILRCAHYIEAHLRPALKRIVDDDAVLKWESYTRGEMKGLQGLERRPTLLGGLGTTFQGLIFFIPAAGFLFIGTWHNPEVTSPQWFGYGIDFVLILYLLIGISGVNFRKLTPAK